MSNMELEMLEKMLKNIIIKDDGTKGKMIKELRRLIKEEKEKVWERT
jgi:hypothetical protein